jgi:hypothetical protein
MRRVPQPTTQANEAGRTELEQHMQYWGRAFEYACLGLPRSLPLSRFVSVAESTLTAPTSKQSSITLLLDAKIDRIDATTGEYTELKLAAHNRLGETKLLKTWLQSLLRGMPRVCVGTVAPMVWFNRLRHTAWTR